MTTRKSVGISPASGQVAEGSVNQVDPACILRLLLRKPVVWLFLRYTSSVLSVIKSSFARPIK